MRTSEIVTKEMPATTETTTRWTVTCDLCGTVPKFNGAKTCSACDRDICINCRAFVEYDYFSGDYYGDYPPTVCKKCHELSAEFTRLALRIRDRRDTELYDLKQQWREKCKAGLEVVTPSKTRNQIKI